MFAGRRSVAERPAKERVCRGEELGFGEVKRVAGEVPGAALSGDVR